MNKLKFHALFFVAAAFVLMGQACQGGGPAGAQNDGGVYKSADKGVTWTQNSQVLTLGNQAVNFNNEDVRPIVLDPQDHEAVYIGTKASGLLYSYDGAQSWTQDDFLQGKEVVSVAIDYFDKCKWVVATPKRIYRTLDCGRGWREMLVESRPEFSYRVILTDHFNRNTLYAANTKEILKSNDYGETWQTIQRLDSEVIDMVMDRNDSRVVYAALWGGGVIKTTDGGANWVSTRQALGEFRNAHRVRKIIQDFTQPNTYLIATVYGILRTTNGGESWEALELLTPPEAVNIWSIGLHPENNDIIYYATDTQFYKTEDGGSTWKTSKLPTTRRPTWLTVDFRDGNVLYLGTRKVEN